MISTKWYSGDSKLDEVYAIRRAVFIKEQGVAEEIELDGTDIAAEHLLVCENGQPVATGRLIKDGDKLVLGRIAVLREYRGNGYGGLVVRILIRKAFDSGVQRQYVHAQVSAQTFYEKLGFKAYGSEYMEAGIAHINMVHEGDISGCC